VKDSHHEDAASQHGVDLRHADALTIADSLMSFRLVVKEVAREQGVYATFMPKPIEGVQGSGLHTHLSLFEGERNAFFDPTDEYHLSKVGRTFMAGLLAHAVRAAKDFQKVRADHLSLQTRADFTTGKMQPRITRISRRRSCQCVASDHCTGTPSAPGP